MNLWILDAKTDDEEQSPIHYAAKYNAVSSLKIIIENRGHLNDRDYKRRTPIFLAAEMGQQESARFLLEYGAPVGKTVIRSIELQIKYMRIQNQHKLNHYLIQYIKILFNTHDMRNGIELSGRSM